MFFLFIYAPVYVTMRHADSPMYYFCHVIDYKAIRQLKINDLKFYYKVIKKYIMKMYNEQIN